MKNFSDADTVYRTPGEYAQLGIGFEQNLASLRLEATCHQCDDNRSRPMRGAA